MLQKNMKFFAPIEISYIPPQENVENSIYTGPKILLKKYYISQRNATKI